MKISKNINDEQFKDILYREFEIIEIPYSVNDEGFFRCNILFYDDNNKWLSNEILYHFGLHDLSTVIQKITELTKVELREKQITISEYVEID